MFHLVCLTYYVIIMAFILSLFSDAEMMGAGSPAPAIASGVSVPKQDTDADECTVGSSEPRGVIDEWVNGFVTNPVEEKERLSKRPLHNYDPCLFCQYRGLCNDDDCAMIIGPIDMPHAPTRRGWRNFGL